MRNEWCPNLLCLDMARSEACAGPPTAKGPLPPEKMKQVAKANVHSKLQIKFGSEDSVIADMLTFNLEMGKLTVTEK